MAHFFGAVESAKLLCPEDPKLEVAHKIVEHFNRGRMEGVKEAGYFVYQGVKVYAEGKKEEAETRDGLSIEDKVFGKK